MALLFIMKQKLCIRRTLTNIVRLNSSAAPDNAPRAKDNEQWLDSLAKHKNRNVSPPNFKGGISIPKPVSSFKRNSFPIEVLSSPPDSSYIEVRSSLANFTSTKYLQHFNKHKHKQGNFVDVRIIKCRSGKGGDGAISFFRDAGRSIGPPDGGDGGDGGSVYIQAVEGLNSLSKLRTTYLAQEGSNGANDQLDGARGKDVLITVPVGTVVRWCMDPKKVRELLANEMEAAPKNLRSLLKDTKVKLDCNGRYEYDTQPRTIQLFRDSYHPGGGWIFKGKDKEYHETKDWFVDLQEKVESYDTSLYGTELQDDRFPLYGFDFDKPTEKPVCLLKGGKGGLGNMHFLTNLIRNPRFAKIGRSALEQYFMFELKMIADLGLIGLPNAGKSTILNKISNARPRIGHWAFTTLTPTIGTINSRNEESTFTVADIPGIIRDASKDKGMGLEFLRHIERSKGWVFVISIANQDPMADLDTLIEELGGTDKVRRKNVLVVCNKADVDYANEQSIKKYRDIEIFCRNNNWDCLPISALKGENIDVLLQKMEKCAQSI